MFLGAAGIQPLLSETLPQRGGKGQSHSPLEVKGRGKQPRLRQNSVERYCLGLVTENEKLESGQELTTEDGCTIADPEQTGYLGGAIFSTPTHAHTHLRAPQQSNPVG